MQDVLTYTAWLDAVCRICNSLLKATVSVTGSNEFKVVATQYRWVTFVDCDILEDIYDGNWEPVFGATKLIETVIDRWEQLIVEENT